MPAGIDKDNDDIDDGCDAMIGPTKVKDDSGQAVTREQNIVTYPDVGEGQLAVTALSSAKNRPRMLLLNTQPVLESASIISDQSDFDDAPLLPSLARNQSDDKPKNISTSSSSIPPSAWLVISVLACMVSVTIFIRLLIKWRV